MSSSGGGDPGGPPHAPVIITHGPKSKTMTEEQWQEILGVLEAAGKQDLLDLLQDL